MRFSSLLSAALSFASVVYAQQTNGQNSITFPLGGVLDASLPLTIKWTPTTKGTITIKLLKGPPTNILDIEVVAASVENTGTFTWTIPGTVQGTSSLPPGERYGLKIIDDLTSTFEYSPPFDISAAPADPVPVAGPTAVTSVASSSSSSSAPSSSTDSSTSPSTISTSTAPPPTASVESSPPTTAPAETPKSTNLSSPILAPTASTTEASLQSSLPSTTFATSTRTGTTAESTSTDDTEVEADDDKKSESSSGPNIVLIAGVVGGVVGLGLVVLAVIVILKRRSKRRESAHIPMRERPSSLLSEGIYNKIKANE